MTEVLKVKEVKGIDIPTPFKRMTWHDAMNTYGSDKPDNRFGIELQEITHVFKDSEFKVLITNTRIMFREGAKEPCFISNNEFVAESVSIKERLRFGQFVWAVRANGNLGLSWKESI